MILMSHSSSTWQRFHFGYGITVIIPVNILENITMEDIYTVEEEEYIKIKPYLPIMTVEKGHKILSHRIIRSLLAVSINEV